MDDPVKLEHSDREESQGQLDSQDLRELEESLEPTVTQDHQDP